MKETCSNEGCEREAKSIGMCARCYSRWYRATHYEEIKARRRIQRRTGRSRFNSARQRARSRRLSWSIPYETYVDLIDRPCYYCSGNVNGSGVGLDRLDNSKGYEPTNVVPCCGPCNSIRGDSMSSEEAIVVIRVLRALREGGPLDKYLPGTAWAMQGG